MKFKDKNELGEIYCYRVKKNGFKQPFPVLNVISLLIDIERFIRLDISKYVGVEQKIGESINIRILDNVVEEIRSKK